MINLFKNLAILSLIVISSVTIGIAVNALIPWIWLTYFFTIIRNLAMTFNFIWDVPTTLTLAGIGFSIQVLIMTVELIFSLLKSSGLTKN